MGLKKEQKQIKKARFNVVLIREFGIECKIKLNTPHEIHVEPSEDALSKIREIVMQDQNDLAMELEKKHYLINQIGNKCTLQPNKEKV